MAILPSTLESKTMNDQEILDATGRLRVEAKANIRNINATMTANLLSIHAIRQMGNAATCNDVREQRLAHSLEKFVKIYTDATRYLWSTQSPAADIHKEHEYCADLAKKIEKTGKAFEDIAPILKARMLQDHFTSVMFDL